MKAQRVVLSGATTMDDVAKTVIRTRFREARSLAGQLERRERRGLHDFRIACKRLRYALERFAELDSSLELPASRLAHLQDLLGETHDRDVLLAIVPPSMGQTERRLRDERESFIDRAVVAWNELLGLMQAVDSHHF